jgi:PAS domain S-box-containing protein
MKAKRRKKVSNLINDGHFQALIENAHDGIVVYDATGKIKYASKSVKKVLGFRGHRQIRNIFRSSGGH